MRVLDIYSDIYLTSFISMCLIMRNMSRASFSWLNHQIEHSYSTQLINSYLMTMFRCPSDILFTSCWLFTTRWCTWPRNHLVPCVAELVGSCIPIHACRGLPNPKCLFDPSGLSLCLPGDHFCTVTVDDVVLFRSMVSDGRHVGNWAFTRYDRRTDRSVRPRLRPTVCQTSRTDRSDRL